MTNSFNIDFASLYGANPLGEIQSNQSLGNLFNSAASLGFNGSGNPNNILGSLTDTGSSDIFGGYKPGAFPSNANSGSILDGLNFDNAGGILKGLGALASVWQGMQQLNLANDQFKFQKRAYNQNYDNQVSLTNTQLRDQAAARYAADPAAYSTPEEYMRQNGLTPRR